MAKKNVLGKGFGALIPENLDQTILEEDKNRVQKLLIGDIKPNPQQPRGEIDPARLGELTLSVKQHGVLQPIIVVRQNTGYLIVAGERRWRAARAAGMDQIPAIVRSLKELEQIELALIENIQRVDLSPLDQALSVYRLQQQFNLSLEEVSKKLGKAPSTVSNLTRLLQLPESARQALSSRLISEGHARAILALKANPANQEELLSYILNNTWSVRQAEQFVIEVNKGGKKREDTHQATDDEILTNSISTKIGANVKIRRSPSGGQVIIRFKSSEELQKIAQAITGRSE